MVADTVLFCHTKKFKKGKIKEGPNLNAIHDENDVLTDDELVVVRGLLRKSKHAFLYIQNEYPRGFRLLNYA